MGSLEMTDNDLLRKRQISVLHDIPLNHAPTTKKLPKRVLIGMKNDVLNSYFIQHLEARKFRQNQIADIVGQIDRLGYNNVNDLFLDGYFFDEQKEEFVCEKACPIKIAICRPDFRQTSGEKVI